MIESQRKFHQDFLKIIFVYITFFYIYNIIKATRILFN